MPLYEHVFLARQDLSPQQVEELSTQYKGIIEQMGGKIAKTEYWGVKSLAFRIRKNRKAHMTLLNIDAPPSAIGEIERQERINEDVLRYITVRVETHEEGPSAMMRKSDRDERRGDEGGALAPVPEGEMADQRRQHRRREQKAQSGAGGGDLEAADGGRQHDAVARRLDAGKVEHRRDRDRCQALQRRRQFFAEGNHEIEKAERKPPAPGEAGSINCDDGADQGGREGCMADESDFLGAGDHQRRRRSGDDRDAAPVGGRRDRAPGKFAPNQPDRDRRDNRAMMVNGGSEPD